MNETKRLRNTKKAGRERVVVEYGDFAKLPPTKTMLLLAELKNEGHSWQTLADEISARLADDRVSHALVREVTLGHCNSPKVDYALGFREQPPAVPVPPCAECGKVHDQLHTCPHELQKARTRPPRIRSHYEHGYGDAGAKHKAELQAEWEAAGCDSFTDYVDYLRGE